MASLPAMTEPAIDHGMEAIAFEAFGVRILLAAQTPAAFERLPELLPPGSRAVPRHTVDHRLSIGADPSGTYEVSDDGVPMIQGAGLDLALMVLDGQLRARVALHAPDKIFVHAGVVAHMGRTMVIPGRSFTGKTTVVAALVRAGAIYYSDEFAVFDDDGLVHPYAKPLSLRGADQAQSDHHVHDLGGVAGVEPLPVGAVVVTSYRPGAEWRPQPL